MARRVDGVALLVAGHGAIGGTRLDVSAVHTLGQIGEALLATGASWQIRRLSAAVGERIGADRGTLKHHIDELVTEPVRVAMLVMLGVIADAGGPALVTSSQVRAYPEDATLPLAWIGERLRAAKAEHLVVVMSARADAAFAASVGALASGSTPRVWLDSLATGKRDHVVAVAASEGGSPLVDALLTGLCGDALDPRTGTVTLKSISAYLGKRVPAAAIQGSEISQTLASSPPLAGLWDVRRSQLALLGTLRSRPASGEADDLTQTVLPGRFRLDAVVARGTFGTVYRAHQLSVERDVAVKVLHADIDPASDDGRLFVHEVRAVGRIDHPNVVRIHQADITHDGRLFYAMELLEGRDLQQVVGDDSKLPKERAVDLVRQLLDGLGAAHDAGLVHADVKPANAIVVSRDGKERVVLVDFGLARLRAPDRASESAGGTPAYMAPEQLHEGRVDARSDLFSAALVLVTLLTGWRRPNAYTLLPPLTEIPDRELRDVLGRALSIDPAHRFQSARELAAALTGTTVSIEPQSPVLPFRLFAALTEQDDGRLHGRGSEIAALTEHVLYRRSLVYTAPSGTGKTSLLRAGLLPRLTALGVRVVYLRCRNSSAETLAAAIAPEARTVADALARHHQQGGGKLVLVLDQLEAALADGELVEAALDFARWPAETDVAVVLSVREDHLARLLARTQKLEPGIAIMRLPPLPVEGARAAIVGPLTEARLAIEPELLDELLADLREAAAAIAPEMGWGDTPAVYPPHLQLACSVLYEALGPGEATLTLAHYKRLGGFAAIVGEHLERVLDVELAGGRDAIARDLFVALVVSGTQERAMRGEAELLDVVGAQHGREAVTAVLETLREKGLLVRVRGEGEPSWELVHDSLVPRVLAWVDARDLARRRAIELVRYHLRRSQPDAPSLLDRTELRELRPHGAAIDELDREWRESRGDVEWTPARLVRHSRSVLRRRVTLVTSIVAAALAIAGGAVARNRLQEAEHAYEQSLLDRDIGRFTIEIAPFDWDPVALKATPVDARQVPGIQIELRYPDEDDSDEPGKLMAERHLALGKIAVGPTWQQSIEAHGGRAFLIVHGRGRAGASCGASTFPVVLPGYSERKFERVLQLKVPTCAATLAGMIQIPAGRFLYGGAGDPVSPSAQQTGDIEKTMELPAFEIDRTEVSNAAFSIFSSMATNTGVAPPSYPVVLSMSQLGSPERPVTGITWSEAHAFCRWFGKRLPTSPEWTRLVRGGERLPDGRPNPHPRRNLPWGTPRTPVPARLSAPVEPGAAATHEVGDDFGAAPIGSHPDDRSVEGVLDLAGNAVEWTDTQKEGPGFRIVRGGGALETRPDDLLDFMAVDNIRPITLRYYDLGVRCAHPPNKRADLEPGDR